MIADETRVRPSTECLISRSGADTYLLAVDLAQYFRLNAMGARIWELLDARPSFLSLCNSLLEEFDVSETQCRSEADRFIKQLDAAGLVSLETP